MTVRQLQKAVADRRSVAGLPWGRVPAAVLSSMQFRYVMQVLPKLKLYKPKGKRK